MARAQGVPDFPIAAIRWDYASMDMVTDDAQLAAMAEGVTAQIESILLGRGGGDA